MRVEPLTGSVGAAVHEVELGRLTAPDVTRIRKELLHFGVLVLRGQQDASRDDHIAFGELLGDLERSPSPVVGHPALTHIVHDAHHPASENIWHSDQSFRRSPPSGSVLRAVELPAAGGDTLFADMRQAYARLAPGLRQAVAALSAVHDVAKWMSPAAATAAHEHVPPVAHPLVVAHPVSGQSILFVNEAYTTQVLDVSATDSAALLDHLLRQVSTPELQCRVRWDEGTVVVWDNRSMQHYAVADYHPSTRRMDRVTMAGTPVTRAGDQVRPTEQRQPVSA